MTETTRIKRLFRNAIRRGTGRAHLLMRAHPEVNFSADILKAACINYAYDPQCEQSRGTYVLELVQLLMPHSRREKTISQILAALVSTREASWGLTQLFDIAGQLADEGHSAARAAFYQRYELGKSADYAYDGEWEFVRLDGVDALLHVAGVRGYELAADSEEWESDYLIELAQKNNPGINVRAALEEAATTNKYVARYLKAVQIDWQSRRKLASGPKISRLKSIQQFIATPESRYLSPYTLKKLTARQVRQLAADFEQENSPRRKAKYLGIFKSVKHPLGHEQLLQMAKSAPTSRCSLVLDDAVQALGLFRESTIREFALARIAHSSTPWRYVDLLANNYHTGDDQLLLRLVEQTTDEHVIESLASSLCAIYRKNRTKKCRRSLGAIYQRMNCGLHRADVVELLLKRGVLPADIREEILFDSYEGVRDLAVEWAA